MFININAKVSHVYIHYKTIVTLEGKDIDIFWTD